VETFAWPEPFLDLCNIRLVGERAGGDRRAERMHTQAVHLALDFRRHVGELAELSRGESGFAGGDELGHATSWGLTSDKTGVM
jgi:hypothetical protein